MHKTSFQQLAEKHGFPVPRSVTIDNCCDLGGLSALRFPCIIKPTIKTAQYFEGKFERGYRVGSVEEAREVCRRMLAAVPGVVVQEWIEGPDSDIYFCLQYRAAGGTVASFSGRKLSIWPPGVGVTASCTAAPEVHATLHQLTESFFAKMSFEGMGSMEFKRDARSGEFLMIEPTVGRLDWQEEVATLNGVNIPLAAYRHETGHGRGPHIRGERSGGVARFVDALEVRSGKARKLRRQDLRRLLAAQRSDAGALSRVRRHDGILLDTLDAGHDGRRRRRAVPAPSASAGSSRPSRRSWR